MDKNFTVIQRSRAIQPIMRVGRFYAYYQPARDIDQPVFWLNNYDYIVDYSKLSTLADIKMTQPFTRPNIFKPTTRNIVDQIPTEFLTKTVAFQIMYKGDDIVDMNFFENEFRKHEHVFIVRIYGTSLVYGNPSDGPEKIYIPREIPINMDYEEYVGFCKLQGARLVKKEYDYDV